MNNIKITCGDISFIAQLRDTPTANAVVDLLPITSVARTWGDEIYFEITSTVDVTLEGDAKDVVQAGEIAYWVEGHCIAIGFGPTPVSRGNEIRLAARTNIWADTPDDVSRLAIVNAGDKVTVEAES
ncbi:MAG: cyclophilin-like fold protein [Gammaproteobacteria bacterium]|jgi:hypothetical protein